MCVHVYCVYDRCDMGCQVKRIDKNFSWLTRYSWIVLVFCYYVKHRWKQWNAISFTNSNTYERCNSQDAYIPHSTTYNKRNIYLFFSTPFVIRMVFFLFIKYKKTTRVIFFIYLFIFAAINTFFFLSKIYEAISIEMFSIRILLQFVSIQ